MLSPNTGLICVPTSLKPGRDIYRIVCVWYDQRYNDSRRFDIVKQKCSVDQAALCSGTFTETAL